MIALSQRGCNAQAQQHFETLLPSMLDQASCAFRSSADREELIAEAIANAYCAFLRLVERGKADIIYPTPLIQYAIRQVRCGRRVGTKLNVRDISSKYCQQAKGVSVERLDVYHVPSEGWMEVLVEDRSATPADTAAMRIDFAEWLKQLPGKLRRIAKTLANGETTSNAAQKFRLSPGRISQIRQELRDSWLGFQGELAAAY